MKVFISYAREDQETAKKIYHDLKRSNIDAWIDIENLLPGQNWKAKIAEEIKKCSYFIVLLSSNSTSKKGFVQKELKMALDVLDMMPDSGIYIVPVRIEKCSIKHEKLQKLHWTDLFPSYEEGIKKILKAIKNIRSNHIENEQKQYIEEYKKVSHDIKHIENHLIVNSKNKESIEWIKANKNILVERAAEKLINGASEEDFKAFCNELRRYMELIFGCVITKRLNLIDEPYLHMSMPVKTYIDALNLIKNRIPNHLNTQDNNELKNIFEYLIQRLS